MVENILVIILTAIVTGVAVFIWWFENHSEKTDGKTEKEGN